MIKQILIFLLTACSVFVVPLAVKAQNTSSNFNYGVWQTFGDPVDVSKYPGVKGRLCNFNWKDIEIANNVWVWDSLDIELTERAQDSLPIIFMIYTEEGAPAWIYDLGVPKVAQNEGDTITYAPYYPNTRYKNLFKRMITTVHQHIETLPYAVRKFIIGVQGCYGSTGDYINYKGTVDSQYVLSDEQFFALFTEFSQYYYNEYLNTNPKIYLLSNPQNNGEEEVNWLIQNCPNSWIKCGSIGKGFQLNDEVSKSTWLYNLLNYPQNGEYVRSRSELQFSLDETGWWAENKYRNMFALMTYDIYWGLDWSNQAPNQIYDTLYDPAFDFYNRYAGQKNPSTATNAMCALRDGLNAADTVRFPVSLYGKPDRADTMRYKNIVSRFAKFGARQEDALSATLGELNNLAAKGINDVGWDVFPGNYERYLHQLKPNETSFGYWNANALADPTAMYGKYARAINATGTKNTLYFDVDSLFLGKAPINGKYPIVIDITYLDSGFGGFRLFYDAKTNANKPSATVGLTNTNFWKKASITLYDAYFGNRGSNASDFYIQATNNQTVLFSIVELSRPDSANPKIGLYTSGPLLFDTVCTKSTGSIKSFSLSGYFLNGSNIVISPLQGFSFSTSFEGTFTDSLIISNYGTGLNKNIYVKFSPIKTSVYGGSVLISGGGYKAISITLKGAGINSRPVLTANISNITCNNAKNGAIDLVVTGGAGPFSYNWINDSFPFKSTTEDVTGLIPGSYTVNVNSFGGCIVAGTFIVTQPDILSASVNQDSVIVCWGGSTTVTVSATGGSLPYLGTGSFTVSSSNVSFIVTDAHGCTTETPKITILPGTLAPPSKPDAITGTDARGVCNGGVFYYVVSNVSSATSYAWILPAGTSIKKTSAKKDSIALAVQAGFIEGTILVTANNVCGSSLPASKTITAIPEKPVGITGPVSVLANQAGLIYSVINPMAILTYTWTSSSGTRITAGQDTWQSTITWGTSDGKVNVKANNNCGSSGPASIDVTILSAALQTTLKTNDKSSGNVKSDSVIIMPNPAHTFANLGFIAEKAGTYEMELTDLTGKILLRKKVIAVAGKNIERIDMQSYTSGLYFITLINSKGRITLKIIRK